MKRALLGATICITSFARAQAQGMMEHAGVVHNNRNFTRLDKEPQFAGGLQGLRQYIEANIHYPDSAFAQNVQGVVTVLFTVNKDGKAVNAVVKQGIGKGCDEEALKLVNAMPLWSPGEYNGEHVDVLYRLPVHFIIPDKIPEQDGQEPDRPLVYRYVDQAPEFPGGKTALIKYLSENIPQLNDKNKFSKAALEFLVQRNGKVSDIRLLNTNGSSNAFPEETLPAIIKHMPRWTPAITNGKAVNAYYNLSIGEF